MRSRWMDGWMWKEKEQGRGAKEERREVAKREKERERGGCIVERPTLRGKHSWVTWHTVGNGSRRRKRVSPEEDEGLARRAHATILQRIPCSVWLPLSFSLSLSLSLSLVRDKTNELPSDKTPLPANVNDTSVLSVAGMSNYQGTCCLLYNPDVEIHRSLAFPLPLVP